MSAARGEEEEEREREEKKKKKKKREEASPRAAPLPRAQPRDLGEKSESLSRLPPPRSSQGFPLTERRPRGGREGAGRGKLSRKASR